MSTVVPTRTELLLFDVHTCLPPVDAPTLFQPGFQFLGLPIDYNDNYRKEPFIRETEHFQIRPLSESEIKANHFWRRLPSSKPWYAHLPMVALPGQLEVEVVAEDLGLHLSVDTWVFLWPWGWSANLRVDLEGEVTLPVLAELTTSFKSPHPRRAFLLEGKPVKPTKILQKLGDWISDDVYGPTAAPQARMALSRHFLLSILKSQGEALPYRPLASFGPRRMDAESRGLLHSILLGRAVGFEELRCREERDPRPFLLTEFTGTAFALTDNEQGSVLFLPGLQPAEEHAENLEREHCLTGNAKNCAMLSFGLAAVLEDSVSYGDPGKGVDALLRSARHTIERMLNQQANRLWNGYLMNPRVRKALQQEESLDTSRDITSGSGAPPPA